MVTNPKAPELQALDKLYTNRDQFIILALTGRTGSGCSQTATLLESEWIDLPKEPTQNHGNALTNEDRKYSICYNYSSENWRPFKTISISDIIFSFLLENTPDKFLQFIKTQKISDIKTLSEDVTRKWKPLNIGKNKSIYDIPDLSKPQRLKCYSKLISELKRVAEIKAEIRKVLGKSYSKAFQQIGDNIRKSGNALQESINPENLHGLQKRISIFIQAHRELEKQKQQPCYIVLDSIRSDLEAQYFRSRFSAFYLLSINTKESVRRDRLVKQGYDEIAIQHLDAKEYPGSVKGSKTKSLCKSPANKTLEPSAKPNKSYDKFAEINVQNCIEHSDIHINNASSLRSLGSQLIRYVSLIQHPGLVQPTKQEQLMQLAYTAKMSSGCISRQVGAVVSCENYSVKTVGWNDTPSKQVPCSLRSKESLLQGKDPIAYSDYEKSNQNFKSELKLTFADFKHRGLPDAYCFKDAYNSIDGSKNQVHTRALHAEENAMMQIAKYGGTGLKGGYMFTTASPCELCSKKAYQLNIKRIYYIDPYPGIATTHILKSGTMIPELVLFRGVVGRSYFKLYDSFMPYKDELKIMKGSFDKASCSDCSCS